MQDRPFTTHKHLTCDEAYATCESKMEYAADKIKQAALSQRFGFYMAMTTPVGVHGGWSQEHLYWLNCMNFLETQPRDSIFRIEDEYLYVNVADDWQHYYARQ